MLDKIKLLLSITDDSQDELLQTLIALCKVEACSYCHFNAWSDKLEFVVIQMVVERYNRMGSEGATAQSTSGISTTYDSFYSEKVTKMLKSQRRLVTL